MAEYESHKPTSQIAMFNGLHQFYSLDDELIDNVLNLSLSDPTYLTFRIYFDTDSEFGGLFGKESSKNSALAYFKRIGDSQRYEALQKLIALLNAIQTSASHCFETVEGLQDIWQRSVDNLVPKDKQINIKLTESVDWRMLSLSSLIRYIMYDYDRMIYVLPVNLRSFNMVIYVTELRVFQEQLVDGIMQTDLMQTFGISDASFAMQANQAQDRVTVYNDPAVLKELPKRQFSQGWAQTLNDRLWGVNSNPSTKTISRDVVKYEDMPVTIQQGVYVLFGLGDCEFNVSTGSSLFGTFDVTNEPSMASCNMSISYGTTSISQHLPIIGYIEPYISDNAHDPSLADRTSLFEPLSTKGVKPSPAMTLSMQTINRSDTKTALGKLIQAASSAIVDFAKDFAQQTTLNLMVEAQMQASRNLLGKTIGNVYGLNLVDILTLTNPQHAFMKVKQGIRSASLDKPELIADKSNSLAMSQSPIYPKQSNNSGKVTNLDNVYDSL